MNLFLQTLRERVLFFDGAMGTQVQARELGPEDYGGKRWEGCIDYLSLTRPDVVESIHTGESSRLKVPCNCGARAADGASFFHASLACSLR